ncbi:O-antigen ligase family protein [Benzoatithermus flavus]|uniref:O-antigen ligase family protein n=1 Tax=Benzoatithermus flavus TaxID=3108223 RepID=A0ABU8XXQ0_9PROT
MSTVLSRPALASAAAPAGARGFFSPWRYLVDFLSFEGIVVAYLYSNTFQSILPKPPIDSTVVFFLLSIVVALVIVLREGVYLPGLLLAVSFVPFLAWFALSWTWSPSKIYAPKSIMLMSTVNLWNLLAAGMIIAHSRARMLRFFKLVTVPSVIVALIGLYIYFKYGSFKFAGWDWDSEGRVYNEWGRGVANGAIVILFMCLRSRFLSLRQIVLGGLLLLCAGFVFVSSSRSALLVFVVPVVLFLLVHMAPLGRAGFAISRAQLLLLLLATAAAVSIALLMAAGTRIDSIGRLLKVFQQAENTEIVLGPNRWAYYGAAIRFFLQAPIMGNGIRSFSILFRGYEQEGTHAHNFVLEILTDTGIVGLVLFGLLLYMALRRVSLRGLRHDPLLLCATMFLVGRVVAALLGTELNGQYYLFFAIGLMALRPARAEDAAETDEPAAAPAAAWPTSSGGAR